MVQTAEKLRAVYRVFQIVFIDAIVDDDIRVDNS
jgi:hypothetical protein